VWLEDVVPPEETEAQREVARRTATPLAAGENRFRVHELTELPDGYAVDVLTPDPTTCGGLAESKRIADRAEERYIHSLAVGWWADLLERDRPIIEDGHIEVPTGPGLGVELDEAAVDEQRLTGTDGFG
jgi:L-alanine-DL-glutamate epimerase-like enolase superfamily enzyme